MKFRWTTKQILEQIHKAGGTLVRESDIKKAAKFMCIEPLKKGKILMWQWHHLHSINKFLRENGPPPWPKEMKWF